MPAIPPMISASSGPTEPLAGVIEAVGKALRELRHLGHFRKSLAGQLDGHIDTGDVRTRRYDAVAQQGLGHSHGLGIGQFGGRQLQRTDDQIPHEQVIALSAGVLKIGDRVDPDRVRDLPCLSGEPFDGCQGLRLEYLAVPWRNHEQHIVVLGVGILERLEGLQLRIVLAEEHSVIIAEREEAGTGPERHDTQRDKEKYPPA